MICIIVSILHRWCRSYIEANSLYSVPFDVAASENPLVQVLVVNESTKMGLLMNRVSWKMISSLKKRGFSKFHRRSAECNIN